MTIDPGVHALAVTLLQRITIAVAPVTALGLLISGAYAIVSLGSRKELDLNGMGRALAIMIILGMYVNLAQAVEGAIVAITNVIIGQETIIDRLNSVTESLMQSADPVEAANFVMFSLRDTILSSIAEGTGQLVVFVVKKFQQFIVLFLYVTGPIALALSTIPDFKGVLMHWLRNFIGLHFWGVTFVVIDKLGMIMLSTPPPGSADPYASDLDAIMTTIVIIVAYCMVSVLTMYFVGVNQTGAYLGKAMAITTAMVSTSMRGYQSMSKIISGLSGAKGATIAGGTGALVAGGPAAGLAGMEGSPPSNNLKAMALFTKTKYKR